MASRQTIARTLNDHFENIPDGGIESIGASYSHLTTLSDVLGPNTKSIIAQHAMLENLDGIEKVTQMTHAYLAFNRITCFPKNPFPQESVPRISVLDLAGNPITSLQNCILVNQLIVSSTRIENLIGAPEGIAIIRCGHSKDLTSLEGCPASVQIIECSVAPNLIIKKEHLPPGLKELITDSDVTFQ